MTGARITTSCSASTRLNKGMLEDSNRIPIGNLPNDTTGAALPPSADGYTAYDIKGAGPARGTARILVDKSTGAMYYTSSHYKSFYPVFVMPAPRR